MALNLSLLKGISAGQRSFHRWLAPTLRVLKKRKDAMPPEPPQHRNSFIEWNYEAELYAFGKRLGEEFNKNILRQALTEKSYVVQEESKQRSVGIEPELELPNNDALVVEGEQLISQYILRYLSTTLPRLPLKYVRNIHDFLMHDKTLANISKHIGADDIILCSDFPVEITTLARALKSLTQALVHSSGHDRAHKFINDLVITQLAGKDLTPLCTPENPVEDLDITLKEMGKAQAEPRLIGEAGQNTLLAAFQVGMYSNKKLIGRGCGENIEEANQMAACDALWRIWGVGQNKSPFPFDLELPPVRIKQ